MQNAPRNETPPARVQNEQRPPAASERDDRRQQSTDRDDRKPAAQQQPAQQERSTQQSTTPQNDRDRQNRNADTQRDRQNPNTDTQRDRRIRTRMQTRNAIGAIRTPISSVTGPHPLKPRPARPPLPMSEGVSNRRATPIRRGRAIRANSSAATAMPKHAQSMTCAASGARSAKATARSSVKATAPSSARATAPSSVTTRATRFTHRRAVASMCSGVGGETRTVVERPGGVRIVTVTDANGRLLRRVRVVNGREFVIINNRFRGAELPGLRDAAAAGDPHSARALHRRTTASACRRR